MGKSYWEKHYQEARDNKDFITAGRLLGKAVASLLNIFAPGAIIIGGGFGHNEKKKYLPAAKAEIKRRVLNRQFKTKIIVSELKHAGALGAALLIK